VRAVQLMVEVTYATGTDISTVDVFDKPTIRAMAATLHGSDVDAAWEARSAARHGRGRKRREIRRPIRHRGPVPGEARHD
jgi:hypothetical protein